MALEGASAMDKLDLNQDTKDKVVVDDVGAGDEGYLDDYGLDMDGDFAF